MLFGTARRTEPGERAEPASPPTASAAACREPASLPGVPGGGGHPAFAGGVYDTLRAHIPECVCNDIRYANLPAGIDIATEGDLAAHVFIVITGLVKVFKLLPNGLQQILKFAGPGDVLVLPLQDHYAASAQTLDRTRLCRIGRTTVRQRLASSAALRQAIDALTARDLQLAQDQLVLLGRKNAHERLADFLIRRVDAAAPGGRAPAGTTLRHVSLPMSRTDIGDYLGLRLETVSRKISQLARWGLIEVHAGTPGVAIRDVAGLRRMAEGNWSPGGGAGCQEWAPPVAQAVPTNPRCAPGTARTA